MGQRASSQRSIRIESVLLPFITTALTAMLGGCCEPCVRIATCPECPSGEVCADEKWCDYGSTQIQFYAPPGAKVTVGGHPTRSRQIAEYGPFQNRLEQNPEEFAVFNLPPSRHYEFKYASAEGLPGVTIYGELDVRCPNTKEAKMFQRRAFVPISLPSEYYQRVEVDGPELFAYRSETARTAIDAHDLERLKMGDVVEKVFFVADLEEAEDRMSRTQVKIAELEREIEYADARFRYAYLDFLADVADHDKCGWPNLCASDREFIEWEKKRQRLEQDLHSAQAKLERTRSLLRGDRVLTRRGMMVLATDEVIEHHDDPVDMADDLGEVLVVMRLGGRHFHWGDHNESQLVQEIPFGEHP
jgi:hypothetical protein